MAVVADPGTLGRSCCERSLLGDVDDGPYLGTLGRSCRERSLLGELLGAGLVEHPFFNVLFQVPSTLTFKGGLIRFHIGFIQGYILNISLTVTFTSPFPH